MQYLHWDYPHLDRGDVVEVTLTRAANVELVDQSNFQKFRKGQSHSYYGGLAKRSPSRIGVPRSGRWYVVVHMQGLRGRTNATVRVIKAETLQPLPAMKADRSPVYQIAENLAEAVGPDISDHEYDVFISHASQDKDEVARPLANALISRGISVWYDELNLDVGASLRRRIDEGISRSRFGVVVLSKSFFQQGWSQYELDGLVTLSVAGKQVLLPIWHGITAAELRDISPSLSDRVALDTSKLDIDEIAEAIADAVGRDLK